MHGVRSGFIVVCDKKEYHIITSFLYWYLIKKVKFYSVSGFKLNSGNKNDHQDSKVNLNIRITSTKTLLYPTSGLENNVLKPK